MEVFFPKDLSNSSNEEMDENKNIFETFETIKSIKNRVTDVLNDENQREKI